MPYKQHTAYKAFFYSQNVILKKRKTCRIFQIDIK